MREGQRAQCQLVYSSWWDIVLERGIATVLDVNDVGLFPRDVQRNLCPMASFAGVWRANALVLELGIRLDLHAKH